MILFYIVSKFSSGNQEVYSGTQKTTNVRHISTPTSVSTVGKLLKAHQTTKETVESTALIEPKEVYMHTIEVHTFCFWEKDFVYRIIL